MSHSLGVSLLSGLGGSAGFGENIVARNDDGSTAALDITNIFENGINFFGQVYTQLWVNNNGSVTFGGPRSAYTPDFITSVSNNPGISSYFADVDTRGGATDPTPGGNSTGSNLVYYDFDTLGDRFVVTWDDVGYFNSSIEKLNAFQLILTDKGQGDFDIEFRYEEVNWTTGNASGGSGGLGGSVARAGYTAGTGDPNAYFELPASGIQNEMLALDETFGNTGEIGRWVFAVRSGTVVSSGIPPLTADTSYWASSWGDPHLSTLDGIAYDFQPAGEYIMLLDPAGMDFQIQARMVPIGGGVSIQTAVAADLGGTAVMIDATDAIPVFIGGVATVVDNYSSILVGNDRIFREDDSYTIVFAGADGIVNAGDSRMMVDIVGGRVDLDVRLNSEIAGDLVGLLGSGDDNSANDIALADGTPLARPLVYGELYGQYADDWRVSNVTSSLFTYDTGESPEGFYIPGFPSGFVTLASLDPAVRAAAELVVINAGLSPGSANFNGAVLDYALTGDIGYISSALSVPLVDDANMVGVDQGSNSSPVFGEVPTSYSTILNTPLSLVIPASDANGDALTFSAIDPAHGAVTGGPGGEFLYTPAAGFTGLDSFAVAAFDGNGGATVQMVNVNVISAISDAPAFRIFVPDGFVGAVGGYGSIFGTNAFQDISLLDGAGQVTFDPSFNRGGDIIRLQGDADSYSILRTGSSASFINGNAIVTIPTGTSGASVVFKDGVRTLLFDMQTSAMTIGGQPFAAIVEPITAPTDSSALPVGAIDGVFARAFLAPTASISVSGDHQVFGTASAEQVTYESGHLVLDPSFNRGGDTLYFADAAPNFYAYRLGSSIVILSGDNTATIPLGTVGLTLDFNGDQRILRFDSGNVLVADQIIAPTDAANAVQLQGDFTSLSLDQGNEATEVAINLELNQAYVLTDAADQSSNIIISGFSDDDVIQVTGALSGEYNFSSGDADGDLVGDDLIMSNTSGQISNIISILDVVSPTAFVLDEASAEAAVGWNFISFG